MLFSRIVREVSIVLAVSVIVALAVNALRPDGLPLNTGAPSAVGTATAAVQAEEDAEGAIALAVAAARHREDGTPTVFVDARSPDAYHAGHIAGALNLPLQRFDERADVFLQQVPPEASIITYCDGPHCDLAERLAEQLSFFGFAEVRFLPNGLTRWREAGLPITAN